MREHESKIDIDQMKDNINLYIKGSLSGLRHFLVSESP